MSKNSRIWMQRRKRLSEIIEVGKADDWISRGYDIFSTLMVLVNVAVTVMYTFDRLEESCGEVLLNIEAFTVFFFAVDYVLRLWTARFLYPSYSEGRAIRKYVLSFTGIVDLLSFMTYYLPFFIP